MSPPSRPTTSTTTTTTTTTTPSLHHHHNNNSSRRPRPSTPFLLLTLLLLLSVTPAASISFLDTLKSNRHPPTDCQTDMEISAICYQCASLDPSSFHDIHDLCCQVDGRVRRVCRAWYTQEPKRGRRDVWYY